VDPQEFAPFTQGWLYQFIDRFKNRLNPREYSIIDNLLMHMDGADQYLRDCSASDKVKGASIKIINRIIKHAHTENISNQTQTQTRRKTLQEQSLKAKKELHL